MRTSALVGSRLVEAAFLASGVVIAFVYIYTEGSSFIQLESSGTDALEAAIRVLAGARWRT